MKNNLSDWTITPDEKTEMRLEPTIRQLEDIRSLIDDAIGAMSALPRAIAEAEFWRRKYNEHLNHSFDQTNKMVGDVFMALLKVPEEPPC